MYMFNPSGVINNLTAMSPYPTVSAPQSPYDTSWPHRSIYPSTQLNYGGFLPMQLMQQTLTDAVTESGEANRVPTSTPLVPESRTTTSAPISRLRYLSQGTGWHRRDAAVFADDSRSDRFISYAGSFIQNYIFTSPAREARKSKEFNRHTADFDPRAPR